MTRDVQLQNLYRKKKRLLLVAAKCCIPGTGYFSLPQVISTHPKKTNMSPEKQWLEDVCLSFWKRKQPGFRENIFLSFGGFSVELEETNFQVENSAVWVRMVFPRILTALRRPLILNEVASWLGCGWFSPPKMEVVDTLWWTDRWRNATPNFGGLVFWSQDKTKTNGSG